MYITEKRAELLKEWLLSCYANDGRYYNSVIAYCIPDGEDVETVLIDLQDGEYDEDITDMIRHYKYMREIFGKYGFYVKGKLYHDINETIKAIGYKLPDKLYKNGNLTDKDLQEG